MSQEWCFPNVHPRAGLLDVRKDLDNLKAFIIDVKSHPPMLYHYKPKVNVADF